MELSTCVNVVIPREIDQHDAPVIYLLHGLSDNASAWTRYTACEQYAREKGVILVMPEVQRSFYADMVSGLPYFRYVSEELPALCQRLFGLSTEREKNYVMGLSMGGYGALKCALTYPERYASVASFSGVADLAGRAEHHRLNPKLKNEFDAIFGSDEKLPPESDIFALLEKVGKPLPGIYLSCGEQDDLYEMNVRLDERLNEMEIPHRFDHRAGIHNWRFWDRSLQDALEYFFG